jgi:hypothetical protein
MRGINVRRIIMHASLAFVNGAGIADGEDLRLLNTLLSSSATQEPKTTNEPKTKDERQADEENRAPPATKPDSFQNDPNDPKNPNEVRERHLKKIKR